jgi:mannose/cellobiose epimerase-like protein (N-acyl-D-glucosamine 2-epimerase family)
LNEVWPLGARIEKAKSWLNDEALPFWSRVGVDGQWGFVEHLTLGAEPARVGYKRLRVQARQTYVFSHAYLMGYAQGIDIARNGWRFMCEHGWCDHGGWARLLGRRGGALDPTLDLYDQAFALYAAAWWIKASGDEDAVALALRTLEVIDEQLSSPQGVGWLSATGPEAALLQNPHMHLLEALLALHEATGHEAFRTHAGSVLEIFEAVLFDPESGTVGEYFDRYWNPTPDCSERIIEPGHHYEWVWLLYRADRIIPGSARCADALFTFAERFGLDPDTGLVYDEIVTSGDVRRVSYRCWPNTEALKAHLARYERSGVLESHRIEQIIDNLFQYFLAAPTRGTWIDQLDAERNPAADKIPASTLYHLHLAFAELMRLESELRGPGTVG